MNEVIDMGSIGESKQTTWDDVTAASADNETRAKLEARFPARKEKRIVEVKLTAEERAERGNELAALVQEIDVARNYLKETAARLREDIKALEGKRADLAQAIADGTDKVEVDCTTVLIFEQNAFLTRRDDTGEIVAERALSAAERQGSLFDESALDNEIDDPDALLEAIDEEDEDA